MTKDELMNEIKNSTLDKKELLAYVRSKYPAIILEELASVQPMPNDAITKMEEFFKAGGVIELSCACTGGTVHSHEKE